MRVLWVLGRTPAEASVRLGASPHSRGGWQDALLDLVAAAPGIELTVAYPGPDAGTRIQADGVSFVSIGPLEASGRLGRVAGRWFPGVPGRCIDACERVAADLRPDVVHFHGTESGLPLAAPRIASPSLLSIQGVLSVIRDSTVGARTCLPRPGASAGEFARGLSPWHSDLWLRAMASVEGRVLAGIGHVAGRTEFDRRETARLAPSASYSHVGEVLRRPFRDVEWRPDGSDTRRSLVMIGSDYVVKGIDVGIEAFHRVAALHDDLVLDVVGMDPTSYTGRWVRVLAEQLRLGDRIRVSGMLSAPDVVERLSTATAFVHPSRADNSPNSLCEAMSLGVPCVASTAGGIPSLASDGVDALLVPPGDPGALAEAIERVLSEAGLAQRLGAAARSRARERHEPAKVLAELLDAYRDTVGAAAAPRDWGMHEAGGQRVEGGSRVV